MTVNYIVDLIERVETLASEIKTCEAQIAADHFVGDNEKEKAKLLTEWYNSKEEVAMAIRNLTWEGMKKLDEQLEERDEEHHCICGTDNPDHCCC